MSHFDHQGVIIGGIAISLLGQARFTEDLDAMVLLSVGEIPHFLQVAQKEGIEPRILQADEFARHNRVLLLHHTASQTNIDISLGILPFEQEMVARSSPLLLIKQSLYDLTSSSVLRISQINLTHKCGAPQFVLGHKLL